MQDKLLPDNANVEDSPIVIIQDNKAKQIIFPNGDVMYSRIVSNSAYELYEKICLSMLTK